MRNRGRVGIPTLTMSSFMTALTTNCTKGRSSPGTRSVYTSRAPYTSSCPTAEIGWWGLGTGMKAYHTFLLVKTDQGCHIITEEVVRGEGAIKFRQEQPNAMHDGHDLWLKVIKERSEKQN